MKIFPKHIGHTRKNNKQNSKTGAARRLVFQFELRNSELMRQIRKRQWAPRHISAPISQIYDSGFELSPLRRLAALLHRRIQPQTKSYSSSSKRDFRASSFSFARAACAAAFAAASRPSSAAVLPVRASDSRLNCLIIGKATSPPCSSKRQWLKLDTVPSGPGHVRRVPDAPDDPVVLDCQELPAELDVLRVPRDHRLRVRPESHIPAQDHTKYTETQKIDKNQRVNAKIRFGTKRTDRASS